MSESKTHRCKHCTALLPASSRSTLNTVGGRHVRNTWMTVWFWWGDSRGQMILIRDLYWLNVYRGVEPTECQPTYCLKKLRYDIYINIGIFCIKIHLPRDFGKIGKCSSSRLPQQSSVGADNVQFAAFPTPPYRLSESKSKCFWTWIIAFGVFFFQVMKEKVKVFILISIQYFPW